MHERAHRAKTVNSEVSHGEASNEFARPLYQDKPFAEPRINIISKGSNKYLEDALDNNRLNIFFWANHCRGSTCLLLFDA